MSREERRDADPVKIFAYEVKEAGADFNISV